LLFFMSVILQEMADFSNLRWYARRGAGHTGGKTYVAKHRHISRRQRDKPHPPKAPLQQCKCGFDVVTALLRHLADAVVSDNLAQGGSLCEIDAGD
jgi:hypothetical protein